MAPRLSDEALAADMAALDALSSSFFTLSSLAASGDARDVLSDASAPISFGLGSSCEIPQPCSTGPLTEVAGGLPEQHVLHGRNASATQLQRLHCSSSLFSSGTPRGAPAVQSYVPPSPGADYAALCASTNSLPSLGLRLGHSSVLSVYVPETPLEDYDAEPHNEAIPQETHAWCSPHTSNDPSKSHPSSLISRVQEDAPQTQLVPAMLVWAPWRGGLWAPALLSERTSRTRDLWRVRFAHWRDERLSPAIPADEMLPCSAASLIQGDRVCVVQNRRRMDTLAATFCRWAPDGRLLVLPDDFDMSESEAHASAEDLLCVSLSHVMLERSVIRHKLRDAAPRVSAPQTTEGVAIRTLFSNSVFVLSLGERSSLSRESGSARRILVGQIATRIARMGGRLLPRDTSTEEVLALCLQLKQQRSDPEDGERRVSLQRNRLSLDSAATTALPEKLYLLTDGTCCRTAKAFVAARLGAPVVHVDWLSLCEHAQGVVPWHAHAVPLRSDGDGHQVDGESRHGSEASKTYAQLEGRRVALVCSQRAATEWKCVVHACGALDVRIARAEIAGADLVIAQDAVRVQSLIPVDSPPVPIVTLAHFLDSIASFLSL